jgi:hypothetical protein
MARSFAYSRHLARLRLASRKGGFAPCRDHTVDLLSSAPLRAAVFAFGGGRFLKSQETEPEIPSETLMKKFL